MAQFDVHESRLGRGLLLLDMQSNLLADLDTRLAMPLRPLSEVGRGVPRLMPIYRFFDADYVVLSTELATVTRSEFGRFVGSLEFDAHRLIALVDYLLTGY
jgi:toxin CcdB